jgi:hypothetical protein
MRTELKSGGDHHYTTGLNAMTRQCASDRNQRKSNGRERQSVARPRHIFDAWRGADSGQKLDEKIGDFRPLAL